MQPSLQDELEKLQKRIDELESARAKEKLDERFQDLANRLKLGLDKLDAEIAINRGNLTTIAEQLQQSNQILQALSSKVDENALRLSQPITFELREDGKPTGQVVPKLLGERLIIDRQWLK